MADPKKLRRDRLLTFAAGLTSLRGSSASRRIATWYSQPFGFVWYTGRPATESMRRSELPELRLQPRRNRRDAGD